MHLNLSIKPLGKRKDLCVWLSAPSPQCSRASFPHTIILGCDSSSSPSALTNTPRRGRQLRKARACNKAGEDILQQGADRFWFLPLSVPMCTCHHSHTEASTNKHNQLLTVYFGVMRRSPYTMLR